MDPKSIATNVPSLCESTIFVEASPLSQAPSLVSCAQCVTNKHILFSLTNL